MDKKEKTTNDKAAKIGCASLIGILVVIVTIASLHQHFGDHAQALAYQSERVQIERRAAEEARAQATRDAEEKAVRTRHEADALRNHNRRLLWQKQHPAEYAAQLIQSRKLAHEREQKAIAVKQLADVAQKAAEEAQTRQAAEIAAAAERKRVAEANQPKADELERAQTDLTAEKISGNADKYVNSVVKLKCKVLNVVAATGANAFCGSVNDDSSELSAAILLTGDEVAGYDAEQIVQFVGTVEQPTEGTNAMGGTRQFPTVRVDFEL